MQFRLDHEVTRIDAQSVTLKDGSVIVADLVIVGTGVKPRLSLAQNAGLDTDDGVIVDARLCTSDPDIFAAGDIACWSDRYTGSLQRIEHWFVAQRHGATAARNMLGAEEMFADVPFFWSKHYDKNIRYSGHAKDWDRIETAGSLETGDYSARYFKNGKPLAIATINRDRECLVFEAELEQRLT